MKLTIAETLERARKAHEDYIRACKIAEEAGAAFRKAQAVVREAETARAAADDAVIAVVRGDIPAPAAFVPSRGAREDEPTQAAPTQGKGKGGR